MNRAVRAELLCVLSICGIVGCDVIGPGALRQSRPDYNEVIEKTSKDQVFVNIVRTHLKEPTLFMDVTEVDVQLQFQNTLSGSANLPQMKTAQGQSSVVTSSSGTTTVTKNTPLFQGHDFSVNDSLQFTEQPTLRYQPLQGQALIAQMATPIQVDSLVTLYDSDWAIGTVLDLAVDRLTPGYADYYTALNAISELDDYGAIVIAPSKSAAALQQDTNAKSLSPNDILTIYIEPTHLAPDTVSKHGGEAEAARRIALLWLRLVRIYDNSLSEKELNTIAGELSRSEPVWDDVPREIDIGLHPGPLTLPKDISDALTALINSASAKIAAGTGPGAPIITQTLRSATPFLRMRSAKGILHQALESSYIEFIDLDDKTSKNDLDRYKRCERSKWWVPRNKTDTQRDYYIKLSGGEAKSATEDRALADWYHATKTDTDLCNDLYGDSTTQPGPTPDPTSAVQEERIRRFSLLTGESRRYLLIYQQAVEPQSDAYVWWKYNNIYYFIDGQDDVSKENFLLISHFLTVQASAGQGPLLTPTLNVGVH